MHKMVRITIGLALFTCPWGINTEPYPQATASQTKPVKSVQVLLRPGQTYKLSFSQKLPVLEKTGSVRHEWLGGNIRILEQTPTFVRFRTLTLQEALIEAGRANSLHGANIDLNVVRFDYEHGLPFSLNYMAITSSRMDTEMELLFPLETAPRRRKAKRVEVKGRGIEIAAEIQPKVRARFYLACEGKNKAMYILPLNDTWHLKDNRGN